MTSSESRPIRPVSEEHRHVPADYEVGLLDNEVRERVERLERNCYGPGNRITIKDKATLAADLRTLLAAAQERGEPVAWEVRASNGNIRFWSYEEGRARAKATEWDLPLIPLYARPDETASLKARVEELTAQLNAPELHDFSKGIVLEAAHQRERWGDAHDAGKDPQDWFWLLGWLAGKAVKAAEAGDVKKALHHCISSAAALANWHAALLGANNSMRPGIDPVARGLALRGKPVADAGESAFKVGQPAPRTCPACQAVPRHGYCSLKGCPLSPLADGGER